MELIRIPRIMRDTTWKHQMKGRSVGLVPTMGALHEGHLSLIKRARAENDVVVASIFVNPMQFGPSEDLDRYPRSLDSDMELLKDLEVDTLFLPDNALMYAPGYRTYIDVEDISSKLCGAYRPGHFRGVATVVAKLFNIVQPVRAYFGMKDFQQTVVIKRMAADLNFGIEVVACPIIREHDGLAMSSRNVYLSPEQRKAASVIYRTLSLISENAASGMRDAEGLKALMMKTLSAEPLITGIDYASLYHPETLDEASELKGDVLAAVAVRMGGTRLIDNILICF